ncbi:hypothetical protein [Bradyrhizobium manausense]|uniref:hypothetical protein n=1 Tax=Bradyrhizobium manausense TaxID=989370 RepID=UPI0020115538|nr:hypothetical protein [Bradyrhizobium manausense]
MEHEIIAWKIEGCDGLAADPRSREQRTHLRLHQALPSYDRAQAFMQVSDVDASRALNEDRIETGNSLVDDGLHCDVLSGLLEGRRRRAELL